MTYHVTVCKVKDYNIIFAAFYSLNNILCNIIGTHFGLKIICSNLRWRNKASVLSLTFLFNTAVEEECYMGILFCFSDSELCKTLWSYVLTEHICKLLWLECNLYVGHCCIILCHTNIIEREETISSFKSAETFVNECTGDLSCSVRAEIIEYYRIAALNCCTLNANCRNNKFICYTLVIGICDSLYSISSFFALAVNKCRISLFNSVPVIISVHSIITAWNSCNFSETYLLKLIAAFDYIILCTWRRYITSVKEGMDINIFYTHFLCHFNKTVKMRHMAVNSAGWKKSHKMKYFTVLGSIFHSIYKCFVFHYRAVFNSLGDTGKLLIYNTSCTDICMTYLTVTHLTVRKSYIHTRCSNKTPRISWKYMFKIRLFGSADSIAVICSDTKAVKYH